MHWELDERTAKAAAAYPLLVARNAPADQFGGYLTDTQVWDHRVIQPATWKQGWLWSGPKEIITQFHEGRYTQGLALVVSWGRMWRQPNAIWGPRSLQTIEDTLRCCAEDISKSQSIAASWQALTGWKDGELGWTEVMTSKTLHFLCRSLGFEQDPPVPIDGKWIRETVWPVFRNSIPVSERPGGWRGKTFEAYCRYMTAILTWANQRHWTTTQIEASILDQFGGGATPSGCLLSGHN